MQALESFIKDASTLERIFGDGCATIMAVGGADTGKSSLVECLASALSKRFTTGIVDLDMGQSHIGPPTTVAWAAAEGGFAGWESVRMEEFYFTGAISPLGNLLPSLVGARRLVEKALRTCRKVVVDTTGLVNEPAGRVLKQYKIDMLCPDMVLALEKKGELEWILGPFRFLDRPFVQRLAVPQGVSSKSVARRAEYRSERFRRYFLPSRLMELSLEGVGIRFTRDPGQRHWAGRVVSLRDSENRDLALGIIAGASKNGKEVLVSSPFLEKERVKTLVVGSYAAAPLTP